MNLFDTESEESFYVAGFLAADGCVTDKKSVVLTLAQKDLDHLKLIRTLLSRDNKIYFSIKDNSKYNSRWKDSHLCSFRFGSRDVCESLIKFNIVPRKTHIYTFPKWIKGHPLRQHFMRGYFDGDGTICAGELYGRSKTNQLIISIAGTDSFVRAYSAELNAELNIPPSKILNTHCATKIVSFHGNKIVGNVCSFLYKNATIYLERKSILAFNAITYYNESLKKELEKEYMLSPTVLLPLWEEYGSVNKLVPLLHRGRKTIKAKLIQYGVLCGQI
jgi:hypothetical protein